MADAKQRSNKGMPPGLTQDALTAIDQHHRKIGGGGAGGHVACILLVTRSISNDELSFGRRKKTVGHIDGDALLTFGFQTINEEREINVFAISAVLGAVAFKGC